MSFEAIEKMAIAGLLIGFIYSVPLGPLGQIMLNRSVERGLRAALPMAIFGAMGNFLLCEVFLLGMGGLALYPNLKIAVRVAGLGFLFYIGLKEIVTPLLSGHRQGDGRLTLRFPLSCLREEGVPGAFLLVTCYYISNPTHLAFWMSTSGVIRRMFIPVQTLGNCTAFSAFFGTGSLVCQYVSIMLVRRLSRLQNARFVMKCVSCVLFCITMGYLVVRAILDMRALSL